MSNQSNQAYTHDINDKNNKTKNLILPDSTSISNTINSKLIEIEKITGDLEYWQNKVLDLELQNATNSKQFSQKVKEINIRLSDLSSENSLLKSKLNSSEQKLVSIQTDISEALENKDGFVKNIPIVEENNIAIYNDVRFYL